jgi:predicted RNase H-like nuclease (RuvC/YqgF family)
MGIRPSKKAPKPGQWVNDGDGNYSKQTARINLSVIKRQANEVPREELLLRDVTQQFWELRELRKQIEALKEENAAVKKENATLKKRNKKLEFENDFFFLSNMRE